MPLQHPLPIPFTPRLPNSPTPSLLYGSPILLRVNLNGWRIESDCDHHREFRIGRRFRRNESVVCRGRRRSVPGRQERLIAAALMLLAFDPCRPDATERAGPFDAGAATVAATTPNAKSEGSEKPPPPGAGQRKVFAISPWACRRAMQFRNHHVSGWFPRKTSAVAKRTCETQARCNEPRSARTSEARARIANTV